MKFEINSSDITFSGKGFKVFFERINESCKNCGITYFIVGAFARDIILENIFKQPTGIATEDIDVAIRIDSWDNYSIFINYLKSNHGFAKGEKTHEFISPEGILTDIIPYGSIEESRKVSFPPNFDKEINMLGFSEINDSTLQIVIDNDIEFRLVSIEGITILKFIAWKDREPDSISEKHTRDIGLIIDAYFMAKVSEFATEFSDLFDVDHYDSTLCGARALGRRIKQIASSSSELREELDSLFKYILKEEDNSLFLTQLSNSSSWDYPFSLKLIKSLAQGFGE